MKLIATLAVTVTLLAAQSHRAPLHRVTAIRHWALSDTTRVAVEVSGEFQYRSERLHNPERIYFDILSALPYVNQRRSYTEMVTDKLLLKLRVAETMPAVTRVVLDLAEGTEVTSSQLTNPNRLIIELRAGTVPVIPTAPAVAPPTLPPATISPVLKPDLPAPPLRPPTKQPAKMDSAEGSAMPPAFKPPTKQTAKTESAEAMVTPATTQATTTQTAATHPMTTPPAAGRPETVLGESSKAARRASNGDTSLVRALGLKLGRVVIDAGHGGHDHGTEGPKGLLEKDLVLDVAMRVGKLVEERLGAEVVYTRTDDTFVPLEGRTALADDKKADLFLSIHANSSPVSRIAGMETYYLNFTTAQDSLDVASRENASSQKSISELHDIIQRITLHDKAAESREFAGRIQASLYAFSSRNFPGIKDRGVKKAPFVVLIGAKIPSVLVEIGFLSNPREESLLRRPDYRQKLAEALFRGISRYADGLSHFQVAKAGAE